LAVCKCRLELQNVVSVSWQWPGVVMLFVQKTAFLSFVRFEETIELLKGGHTQASGQKIITARTEISSAL